MGETQLPRRRGAGDTIDVPCREIALRQSRDESWSTTMVTIPSAADIASIAKDVSNWGRWGADDERGALNLITDAKRAAAAALVQDGVSVNPIALL